MKRSPYGHNERESAQSNEDPAQPEKKKKYFSEWMNRHLKLGLKIRKQWEIWGRQKTNSYDLATPKVSTVPQTGSYL